MPWLVCMMLATERDLLVSFAHDCWRVFFFSRFSNCPRASQLVTLKCEWYQFCLCLLMPFTDCLRCPLSGLASGHRVSDLSHDVQRPINDQRSLRYRTRSVDAKTEVRARHRESRVWCLRQKILQKRRFRISPGKCTWYWRGSKFPVRSLLTKIQP